jgi:histidinol-phosphate aminotransferase
MSFFRDNIEAMSGYVPGEQPGPGQRVIKLNTNENPYPPSPAAMEVMRGLDPDLLRRYPDPMSCPVRQAVAKALDVPAEWVLVGNGSDELLSMLFKACCQPGRPAVYPMPTYVYYRTLAQVQDAPFIEVPFDDQYNLPLAQLAAAAGSLTLISNPNSPSGTFARVEQLSALAGRLEGLLVIDEAYVDFADDHAVRLVGRHSNVIVLRTLSKGYSLAGLRVGFGIAQPELLRPLVKVKDHYNVSSAACAIAAAAIADQPHMRQCVARVRASRERLSAELKALGFGVWPSQSNFLLARPEEGDAERIYLGLKAGGILVRYFKEPRLQDKLRITVGTDEQNAALAAALRKLCG